MSVLTVLLVTAVVTSVISRRGYVWALALSGSTGAGAAIVVGSTALPTFYAAAVGAALALSYTVVVRSRRTVYSTFPPGALLALIFVGWTIFVTLVAPFLFNGMSIVTPPPMTNQTLVAGQLTTSNIAQIAYLVLGLVVFVYVARSDKSTVALLGLVVGVSTLLSLWRFASAQGLLPFPEGVFDNSPSFAYIDSAPGGAERFRGILSEPAALAAMSLVTIAYMLARAFHAPPVRRVACLLVAAGALWLGIVSTSATFVIAGLILATIAVVAGAVRFLAQRLRLGRLLGLLVAFTGVVGVVALPRLVAFASSVVNAKIGSSSYNDRSSTDSDSLLVFLDSYGFGVGVGSARGSSFLPTLLSAAGLVGALIFIGLVVTLIRHAYAFPEYRPVVWALLALLTTKLVAGPDLSDSTGVLWISLGLLSKAISDNRPVTTQDARRSQSDDPGSPSVVTRTDGFAST